MNQPVGPTPPLMLDTSVFSLFLKKNQARANLYRPYLAGKLITISVVTFGELLNWALSKNWGAARMDELKMHVERAVVLPIRDHVAQEWALIQNTSPGIRLSENDAWIAASARVYDCTLVTDDNDFHQIPGLRLFTLPR